MNKEAISIFDRVYQSYVTGGDTFTFFFKAKDDNEYKYKKELLDTLVYEGLVEIVSIGEKRAGLVITDKGIDFGNKSC